MPETPERNALVALIIAQRAWIDLPGVHFRGMRECREFESIDHEIDRLFNTDEKELLRRECVRSRGEGDES